jgi:hypothetical protein
MVEVPDAHPAAGVYSNVKIPLKIGTAAWKAADCALAIWALFPQRRWHYNCGSFSSNHVPPLEEVMDLRMALLR